MRRGGEGEKERREDREVRGRETERPRERRMDDGREREKRKKYFAKEESVLRLASFLHPSLCSDKCQESRWARPTFPAKHIASLAHLPSQAWVRDALGPA